MGQFETVFYRCAKWLDTDLYCCAIYFLAIWLDTDLVLRVSPHILSLHLPVSLSVNTLRWSPRPPNSAWTILCHVPFLATIKTEIAQGIIFCHICCLSCFSAVYQPVTFLPAVPTKLIVLQLPAFLF